MAIIYSYPEKASPSGEDLLVITDSAQAAPNKNRTKSLTVDNLASYVVSVSGNITGGGTLNTIPLFTPNGEEIGDSIMTFTTGPDTITVGGRLSTTGDLVVGNRSTFSGYARFNGEVRDAANSSGTAGQVLSSTGAGTVAWATNASSDTTYDLTGQVSGGTNFAIGLLGSDGTLDKVFLKPGSNITLTDDGSNGVTIASSNPGGTVTSVALTMPAAFSVAGSPITSSGTFAVTGAGTASQVVLGDGSLGSLPGGPFLPLAGGTMLGNTLHGDNIKSIYGTGSDLEIYNDGSNSYFDNKTAGQNLIININEFNGTEKFKVVDTVSTDSLMELSHLDFKIYNDGSEIIKADSGAVELSETLKLSKGITNSLELKSYTATAVSTTGPIDPIQNNYAPTQDKLATLCVDTSGNVVRGEQEATFTFTTAQLNGTLGQTLISAPGAGKAVVVTYTDYMMTYTTTGSTTNNLEIRQANLASASASVSLLPSLRFNEVVNNSQAGVAPFYGFYTRDIPTGAGSQGRTYAVNAPTTIHKQNAGTYPAGLTSVSIKIRYRVFDVATF